MTRPREQGFSFAEMLVSVAILLLATSGLTVMLVQNARIHKSKRMASELQASARNCLAMVTARLRSAGWDPGNTGIGVIALDPDLSDAVSQVEVFADHNGDGDTDDTDEQTLIRHSGDRVEWKPTSAVSGAFLVLAVNITNDADGDGTPEPMFVPDSTTDPTRITVRITAESPVPDPITRLPMRYTLSSAVILRKQL